MQLLLSKIEFKASKTTSDEDLVSTISKDVDQMRNYLTMTYIR